MVSNFGFSGANFFCGKNAHESRYQFEILYLSLFKYGGDKLFLPVYFLSCVVLDKKGNTLETIQ